MDPAYGFAGANVNQIQQACINLMIINR